MTKQKYTKPESTVVPMASVILLPDSPTQETPPDVDVEPEVPTVEAE